MVAGPEPCVRTPGKDMVDAMNATADYRSEHGCVHSGPCDCEVSIPATGSCYCTGKCRELGYCPNLPVSYPRQCGHVFPWYGIIPPSYCPICGAYIGPVYCPPAPRYTITVVSNTTTTAKPKPQGETIS
jgi:hypothetical protein